MAVNVASPSQAPEAYWAVVNSVRHAGWSSVRPYRVRIPSFSRAGYGPDWGFVLASNQTIDRKELDALILPEPHYQLNEAKSLHRLFSFPSASAQHRLSEEPVFCASNSLLDMLDNRIENISAVQEDWNSFDNDFDSEILPSFAPIPVNASNLVIPSQVKKLLLSPPIGESIFCRIAEMLPTLNNDYTRAMVNEFVSFPERFLQSFDLAQLINALVARANELPELVLNELINLKTELPRIDLSTLSLERLGERILAIIALVVILANLASPEAAYAKSSYLYQQPQINYPVTHFAQNSLRYVPRGAFLKPNLGKPGFINIYGIMYPERHFKLCTTQYYSNLSVGNKGAESIEKRLVSYQLFKDTYILENGDICSEVAENTGVLIGQKVTTFVNLRNGHPLLQVASDPQEKSDLAIKLETQAALLKLAVQQSELETSWMNSLGFSNQLESVTTVVNLNAVACLLSQAQSSLGENEPQVSTDTAAPTPPEGYDILPGVWCNQSGSQLIINSPEHGYVYMNGNDWYLDAEMTKPLDLTYPKAFRKFLIGYFKQYFSTTYALERDQLQSQSELKAHIASLEKQRQSLEKKPSSLKV